jgi:hypothetical protein
MTDGAALAQGFMFKNERPGLGLVALRATLILPGHGKAAFRFENIAAMRVVAVHAIHVAFDDGVVLGQVEFGLHIEVALKTGVGFFSGIDDEICRAAGTDMLAAGTVTGFASALAGHGGIFDMQTRMRAAGKFADNFHMTIGARPVANIVRTGNFERRHDDS